MKQKYSIEDGLSWKEMYESGLTFEQIALEVGAATETIRLWALRAGLVPRPPSGAGGISKPKIRDGVVGKTIPVQQAGAIQHYGRVKHLKGRY